MNSAEDQINDSSKEKTEEREEAPNASEEGSGSAKYTQTSDCSSKELDQEKSSLQSKMDTSTVQTNDGSKELTEEREEAPNASEEGSESTKYTQTSSDCSSKELDQDSDSVASQLKKLNLRMNEYEKQINLQNKEIVQLKEKIKEKDKEIEKYQTRNQDSSFAKNRLKEKDKEVQNMKQEFNRNRSLVGDLQMSVKQIHNQLKSMANNALEFEDRLSDIEKLSPKMGVFEWRLEHYGYHSQNSEYLCSPEFYTHLNGYCCYLSVQWFGNKNGRLGLYLHLNKKKNLHLVETCKVNMLIQCVGCFGLTKDHVTNYDADDVASDSSVYELDESIISGDHYFLLKPFLDKYLIDDCLYFYVYQLPDPCLEV